MLTRCPACQTVFRVSEAQLAARAGRVRCGHCLNAFNALQNAVDGAAGPAPEAAPGTTPEAAPIPATPPHAPAQPAPESEAQRAAEEPASSPASPDLPAVFHTRMAGAGPARADRLRDEWDAAASPAPEPAVPAPGAPPRAEPQPPPQMAQRDETMIEAAVRRSTTLAAPTLSRDVSEDDHRPRAAAIPVPPPALARATAAADRSRAGWGIALGGLAMLLLVQGLFLLRQPLSQALPALRPPLAALCARLGCDLPLPREAGEISIETSDLHPEAGDQGDFVLHATLKNRAGFPQAYPHVELSLTDAGDRPLARRVFAPAEWAPGLAPDAAFAPGATAEVALPFNASGVAAVGYRVYAFYP